MLAIENVNVLWNNLEETVTSLFKRNVNKGKGTFTKFFTLITVMNIKTPAAVDICAKAWESVDAY